MDVPPKPSLADALRRGLVFKCPQCGRSSMWRGWFRPPSHCDECGRLHDREDGYWFNSTIINYGLTGLIGLAIFFGFVNRLDISLIWRVVLIDVIILLLTLFLNPFVRAWWVAIDVGTSEAEANDFVDSYSGPSKRWRELAKERAGKSDEIANPENPLAP